MLDCGLHGPAKTPDGRKYASSPRTDAEDVRLRRHMSGRYHPDVKRQATERQQAATLCLRSCKYDSAFTFVLMKVDKNGMNVLNTIT